MKRNSTRSERYCLLMSGPLFRVVDSGRSSDCQYFIPFGGLGEIAIDSNFVGAFAEFLGIERSQRTQHNARSPTAPTNTQRRLEAIHLRHRQIEEDHLRAKSFREVNGPPATLRHVDLVTG